MSVPSAHVPLSEGEQMAPRALEGPDVGIGRLIFARRICSRQSGKAWEYLAGFQVLRFGVNRGFGLTWARSPSPSDVAHQDMPRSPKISQLQKQTPRPQRGLLMLSRYRFWEMVPNVV